MSNIIKLSETNYQYAISRIETKIKLPGSFILAPTETVYGLMCLWNNQQARDNIYKAKNRPENKPFQMLASNISMIEEFGGIITPAIKCIIDSFCPGPMTLIIPEKNGEKLGFRIPDHNFILNLINSIDTPLAATSANVSGDAPALKIDDALNSLHLQPDLSIDGGELPSNSLPSTVAMIENDNITILREGLISLKDINTCLGK
ncbi:MAG TPA: L-threonylcarbamoyladenylate synthase [Victivallales bacterium]|nr:L-threonylcarbamoyladenylate synthase [Victivallales bacterium]